MSRSRTRQYLALCLERTVEILVVLHLGVRASEVKIPKNQPVALMRVPGVSSLSRGHFSSSFTGEMSESCLIFVSSLAICFFETKAAHSQGEHSEDLTAAQSRGRHGITKQRHRCSRTDSYQF